jgi:Predicted nucleotidyltransferase
MLPESVKALLPPQLPWMEKGLLYITKTGSQAYGTALPDSDLDVTGIAQAPWSYLLGCQNHFDESKPTNEIDCKIYSLQKWAALASDANPNVLELLFTDPNDWLYTSVYWEAIWLHRHKFLSKRIAKTFAGYAQSQLHRIKTHRNWLLNPVKAPPTREEMGLPAKSLFPKEQLLCAESMCQKITDKLAGGYSIQKHQQIEVLPNVAEALGFDTNFIRVLQLEKAYETRVQEFESYQNWAKNRNPKRQELERKFGYDTKHAMHLVRLLRMGMEGLLNKSLQVKRPDAEELLAIRQGAWTFEQLIDWSQEAETEIKNATLRSSLSKEPDRIFINDLITKVAYRILSDHNPPFYPMDSWLPEL